MINRIFLLNGTVLCASLLVMELPLQAATPLTSSDANTVPIKSQKKGRVVRLEQGGSDAPPLQEDKAIRLALRAVSDSVRPLEGALQNVVSEVTRQQYVSVGAPNVVGTMVIPARPGPTGQIPIGDFLPPRQQYMSTFAAQVQASLTRLIEQASMLPDDSTDTQLNQQISTVKNGLDSLRIQNQSLQASMAGAPYNNLAVGKTVVNMSDQIKGIKKSIKAAENTAKKIERNLK